MVLLYSEKQPMGSKYPSFELKSVDDKTVKLDDYKNARSVLLAFICNHCPYVKAIEDRIIALAKAFPPKDMQLIAISSNDPKAYPEDSKAALFKRWQEKNYGFPYLLDEDQELAKAYQVLCTPEFFLLDQNRELFYHGRLDDSWQDEKQVKKQELKEAIEALLKGDAPPEVQHPSMGCSIKWKK